jgi:CRISPR-associated protein Cas1
MSALPVLQPLPDRQLPDYLPARMVNEFVYCPRLFFYEWVEGLFRESKDTLEGSFQHKRVDAKTTELPPPEEVTEQQIPLSARNDKGEQQIPPSARNDRGEQQIPLSARTDKEQQIPLSARNDKEEIIHSRSVTLSSDKFRVIAKMDLVEVSDGVVTPVDYKHGKPRQNDDGIELWPTDRVQLAIQGLILRENGYQCEEGVVYYTKTRQRVRVAFDGPLMLETEQTIVKAWELARAGHLPPPLVDSPKCPGCSLVGICLPDETNSLRVGVQPAVFQFELFTEGNGVPKKPPGREVRQMVTPRDDLRPLYINTQGVRVGKSEEVLQIREKEALKEQVRIGEICQVNLMGNIQLSTQAIQTLCELEVPICYFSQGGWFYGITTGLNSKNIFTRRAQFRLAEEEWFALSLSRRLVAGKIRNQRTMLQRNHIEPRTEALLRLKQMAEAAERASSLEQLLGIEGNAAHIYFGDFGGMIKTEDAPDSHFQFDFAGRNRRPPRDPVNAMLSLAYSVLAKDLTIACYAVGLDPYLGFYHQPRFGRPALALDLMEPFRPLIADSAVITAINTRMVTERDFVRAGASVALTPNGRKGFFRAFEQRMDALVTHPIFDYRVSYRRLLEIQARLLARVLDGEIGEYPVFVTR